MSSWHGRLVRDTFLVKPNQLDRERPYIADNIAMTRQAYGLDRFAQQRVSRGDHGGRRRSRRTIRRRSKISASGTCRRSQDTLRQVQEIRTYYDFPDIDIDRYQINGSLREVMLAVRELNVDKLPESSRNWINDKLIYTHGYGITMNPVNGFTPEGLPTLYLSNMPVQSTVPGLNVTRPEIYFGEITNTDVYVKTHQQEFNYPEGQTNNLTSYQGTGGIRDGRLSAPRAAGLRSRRPGQGSLQRRHQRRQPSADAPQRAHAWRPSRRSSPSITIPTSWSATTAASPGSSMPSPPHDTYPYSAHADSRAIGGQLHAQQREGGDRRLRRHHHLLRLR